MEKLNCPACGAALKLSIGFNGYDFGIVARERSDKLQISLNCANSGCSNVYTIEEDKN